MNRISYGEGNRGTGAGRRALIVSTTPALTRNAVWAAGLAGLRCDVATDFAGASWCRQAHVDRVVHVSPERVAAMDGSLMDEVLRQLPSEHERILVPADTRCTRLIAGTLDCLPKDTVLYPLPSLEQFDAFYDKWLFDGILKKLDISHPKSWRITSTNEMDGVSLTYPVVVKPAWGEGSFGVTTLADVEALRVHASTLEPCEERPCIVQEYVPGDDIDLSLLADRGRVVAWAIQQRLDNAAILFLEDDEVYELGSRLVTSSKYHGILHLDMRVDERSGRVCVIEANPRFWGSLCYATWAGVNFLELGMRMAAGEVLSTPARARLGICPYLGVTRRSLPHLLFGGRNVPRSVPKELSACWRFHHFPGNGGLRAWFEEYVVRRPT